MILRFAQLKANIISLLILIGEKEIDKSGFVRANMNYKVIDKEAYYRKDVYRHFTEDCKCSTSMTARIDVTELVRYSKDTGTKFYLNFLYLLSKTLNSRDDYKMDYLYLASRKKKYKEKLYSDFLIKKSG